MKDFKNKFIQIFNKNKNSIITNLIFVIILFIGHIFNIDGYIYFSIAFLLYSFFCTIVNKYSKLNIYIFWILFVLIYKFTSFDIIYITLIMNLFGILSAKCYLKFKDIEKHESYKINKFISFLYPIVLTLVLESFYLINNGFKVSIYNLLFSIIFVYLIWFIILSLFKSSNVSNIFISILLIVFFISNQIKLYFTGLPISYNDIMLIDQAGEIFGIIKESFFESVIFYRKALIVLIINIIFLLYICFNNKISIKKIKIRIPIILISSLMIYVLIFPNQKFNKFIRNSFFNDKDINSLTSLKDYYNKYGVLGGMYGRYILSIDYSEKIKTDKELQEIYDNANYKKPGNAFKKPNIIVMFTEAFWDITKQDDFLFNIDPLKEYHSMKKEGIVISTLSPSFGGSSSNVEYEFLTGGTMSALEEGAFAYDKYYGNFNKKNKSPSIIEELENNGYTTEILNAHSSNLYDCGNIYNYMGVDKQTHLLDKFDKSPDDSYLADKIIEKFETKDKDEKVFFMTLSMESHMPYKMNKYKKYDFNIINSINRRYNNLISAYTQSIRNASLQLERVYNYIQKLDEDTIIIFFGDHLPYLKSGMFSAYDYMKYFKNDSELNIKFKEYNTETLILSNYDIKYDDLTLMSNDLISTTILNNMDINLSDYFKWLYTTKNILPASNSLISVDKKGNIYSNEKLPEDMKEVIDLRKKVQQYLFR